MNINKIIRNKKSIIFVILILTIIITVIILIFKNTNNKHNEDVKTVINNQWNLPSLHEIDYNEKPMLYDFVNGSLGYKYINDNFTNYGIFYCVAIKNDKNEGIYVSSYSYAEELIFPILGQVPKFFDVKDLNLIKSYINNMSKNRVIKEGEYTFCIVSLYKGDNDNNYDYCKDDKWANINIENSGNSENGNMYNNVQKNGWPTEWLRRDYFKDSIKKDGIDISNKFFDKYNVYQILTFYKNGDKDNALEVKVKNINEFLFTYNNGKQDVQLVLNESDLNNFLEGEGYENNGK